MHLQVEFKSYHREAIIHYRKAALADPAYRQRSYWWAELAGCLFLLNKYNWSERCYRKAVELGETRLQVKYLLGDVLLHKGQFSDAQEILKEYLKETKFPMADAFLKLWLSEMLLDRFGDTKRNIRESEQLAGQIPIEQTAEERFQLILEALRCDPLNGLAWYNYAVYESIYFDNKDFRVCLPSALTNDWDVTCWKNTILLAQSDSSPDEFIQILKVAALAEGFRIHAAYLDNEIEKQLKEWYEDPEEVREALEKTRTAARTASLIFHQHTPHVFRVIEE